MENSEQLNAWILQQRNSFLSFFAKDQDGNKPHISQLIGEGLGKEDFKYLGADSPDEAYIGRGRFKKSNSIRLRFARKMADESIDDMCFHVPAPGANGVFIINGTPFIAPIQRLVWSTDPLCDEYRRIDHVLLDGWNRRCNESDEVNSALWHSHAELAVNEDPLKTFQRLRRYLLKILAPTLNPQRQPDALLHYLDTQNKWGVLAAQTQVKTFTFILEKSSGKKKDKEWESGSSPYRMLCLSSDLGEDARAPQAGLDVFHTPENEKIGLTRHLTRGTTVGDDRELKLGCEFAEPGLLTSCVPFAQHNDGRRILMACGMMSQAIPVTNALPSHCQTPFEQLVRRLPGMTEDLGANLLVGFMFWDGLNYEDAIVVSQSAARKLDAIEYRTVSVPIPCGCTVKKIRDNGPVTTGDKLVELSFSPLRLSLRMPVGLSKEVQEKTGLFPEELGWHDPSLLSPCEGVVETVLQPVELWKEVECPGATQYSHRLDFRIRIDRMLEIGDKLSNLHGNKGVVAAILPDKEMPKVDGKPLEVLFNPIGVINRGNYGQIIEALSSLNGGSKVDSGICQNLDGRVKAITQADGASPLYSLVTYQKDGELFEIKAVTGLNYILRLPHYSYESMNVYAEGVYSSITGQPPQGFGQAYGEMEIAALQAHGAHEILKELCHDRSRQPLLQGNTPQKSLQDWLYALGLKLEQQGPDAVIRPVDLCSKEDYQTDILSPKAKTCDDPECNADDRGKDANDKDSKTEDTSPKVLSLATIRRRLSSSAFFNENGPVCLDLNEEVDLRAIGIPLVPKMRFLPILHPRYRPTPPIGNGMGDVTKAYYKFLEKFWRSRKVEVPGGIGPALRPLLKLLLKKHKEKHGITRRVGLSRRLAYSSRLVIIPGPDLAIDQASIPWDIAKVLFRDLLEKRKVPAEVLATPQSEFSRFWGESHASVINEVLRDEWVLLNRNPTLHKYNVMAFHPNVHFDCFALRIPPLVCNAYAADNDGDQMSVVVLRDEGSKVEAVQLSFARNVVSVADGLPTIKPTKDFLLGLSLVCRNPTAFSVLNSELNEKGLAEFPVNGSGDAKEAFDDWIRGDKINGPNSIITVPAALSLVTTHAIRALRRHVNQSCFGSFASMEHFWEPFCISKAAKSKYFTIHGPSLIQGISITDFEPRGEESINVLINGKLAIGDFGSYRRNLYYRIRSQLGAGLAFDGDMREALEAIGSITERATQQALSTKSGPGGFNCNIFKKLVEGAFHGEDNAAKLYRHLELAEPYLTRHLNVLSKQILRRIPSALIQDVPVTLLQFLARPFEDVPKDTQKDIRGPVADPRIALFIS